MATTYIHRDYQMRKFLSSSDLNRFRSVLEGIASLVASWSTCSAGGGISDTHGFLVSV